MFVRFPARVLISARENRFCSSVSEKPRDSGLTEDACTLAYTAYDSKTKKYRPPVVLNHNLMGNRGNLKRIAEEINQITRRMVINADCRNHGDSPHFPEMSYELMTRDLEALIKRSDFPKISFFGNGMGGRVGMLLALTKPYLVEKLIIVNSTPLNHECLTKRYDTIKKSGILMEACRDEILNAKGAFAKKAIVDKILMPVLTDSFDRSLFLTNLNTSGEGDRLWRLNFESLGDNALGTFPLFEEGIKFEGPTLFVTGQKCGFLKESDEEEVLKMFPNAKFVRISDCGYWMQVAKYAEVMEAIIPFLSSE